MNLKGEVMEAKQKFAHVAFPNIANSRRLAFYRANLQYKHLETPNVC